MIKQIGSVAVYVEDQKKRSHFGRRRLALILRRTTQWDLRQAGWRLRHKEPRPV